MVVEGLSSVPEIGLDNKENVKSQPTTPVATCTDQEPNCSNSAAIFLEPKNVTPNKSKGKPKSTINFAMSKFSDVKEAEALEVRKINENLEKIIQQNEIIIWLKKKKLELQYNISFTDVEEAEDVNE